MRHLALAIVLLAAACSKSESPSSAKLDESGFERVASARLRAKFPKDSVERTAALTLRVRRGGEEATWNLDQAYRRYLESPADLDSILDGYTKKSPIDLLFGDGDKVDPSKVIPIVRSTAYYEDLVRSEAGAKTPNPSPVAHEPLNGELMVVYVARQEGSARILHDDEIAGAGIPRGELRERALKNLRAMFPNMKVAKSK